MTAEVFEDHDHVNNRWNEVADENLRERERQARPRAVMMDADRNSDREPTEIIGRPLVNPCQPEGGRWPPGRSVPSR
jgi:hypothetical protein